VEYPSIEPTLPGWCTDGDDALASPIYLVVSVSTRNHPQSVMRISPVPISLYSKCK
jgi:hypothetical protein